MTLNKEGLEAAHAAYERYGQNGDLRSQRLSDGCLSTVITAYLSALPAPDGLVVWLNEAARYFEKRPTGGEDMAFWANVMNAENARNAATVIQTLLRERDDILGDFSTTAHALEAAEQQVRDMREGLEPFARVGDIFELRAGNRPNSDDDPVTEWEDHRVGARRLTVGDFRRARLLLKEGGE